MEADKFIAAELFELLNPKHYHLAYELPQLRTAGGCETLRCSIRYSCPVVLLLFPEHLWPVLELTREMGFLSGTLQPFLDSYVRSF